MKRDFPRNERRPLSSLRRSWGEGEYACYGLFEGETLVGYAFFLRQGRSCLLDYLTVSPECRGRGLGTRFLQRLSSALPEAERVIVEAEDPQAARDGVERETRERRLRFYRRGGYRETGLRSELFGAEYRLLERSDRASSPEELRSVYTEMYRHILPKTFFLQNFRVR